MDRDALTVALRLQAGGCRHYGSPLYADLLEAALAEVGAGGPLEALVSDWPGDPVRGFLPLRVLGAVHERVLAGRAPELARFYPSVGGAPRMPDAWRAFRGVLEQQRDALRPRLERWPQTNEVLRCGALLGGFLLFAERVGRPFHLRELGASAGLHLLWDRYRYALGPHRWGDPASPVELRVEWEGAPPPLGAEARIASRAGCDLDPLGLDDPDARRALESFVWADQPERLAPLRAAVALARRDPPRLDRARAAEWLEAELAAVAPGEPVAVHHSAVWPFLDEGERRRIRELLEARGATSPLAWLGHEHRQGVGPVEVRLRLWPPGETLRLAEGHPHGRRVRWTGAGPDG